MFGGGVGYLTSECEEVVDEGRSWNTVEEKGIVVKTMAEDFKNFSCCHCHWQWGEILWCHCY